MTSRGTRWRLSSVLVVLIDVVKKSDTVIICNIVTEGTIDAKIYHRCLERIGILKTPLVSAQAFWAI